LTDGPAPWSAAGPVNNELKLAGKAMTRVTAASTAALAPYSTLAPYPAPDEGPRELGDLRARSLKAGSMQESKLAGDLRSP